MVPSEKSLSELVEVSFEEFDEELCQELEEVGKELDRYKEESSGLSGWEEEAPSSRVELRESCFPILQNLSQEDLETRASEELEVNSLYSIGPQRANSKIASSPAACAHNLCHKDVNEDETECQMRALHSLKESLVEKVKMMITHKKYLNTQKDSILKNYNGDRAKLTKALEINVLHSKQKDRHIKSLNAQIAITRKKISALENKKPLDTFPDRKSDDNFKEQNSCPFNVTLINGNSLHNKNKPSGIPEAQIEKDNVLINSSLQKSGEGKRYPDIKANGRAPQNCKIQSNEEERETILASAASHLESPTITEQQKPEEGQQSGCDGLGALPGRLAMYPSAKNLNTLWCKFCNLFFTTITGYIRHLKTSEHLDKFKEQDDMCVSRLLDPLKQPVDKGSNQEALGVEFLCSTKIIFCSLCECPMLTMEEAKHHPQSSQHIKKYKEYLLKNTNQELDFLKAKMAAFTEYCKSRRVKMRDSLTTHSMDTNYYKNEMSHIESRTMEEVKKTELQSTESPDAKRIKTVPQDEGNSGECEKKYIEGVKVSPIVPQKINVRITTGKGTAAGGVRRRVTSQNLLVKLQK